MKIAWNLQFHDVPQVPRMEVRQMNDSEIKSALARRGYKMHPYQLDAIAKAASRIITILCGGTASLMSAGEAIMALDIARGIIEKGAINDADNA